MEVGENVDTSVDEQVENDVGEATAETKPDTPDVPAQPDEAARLRKVLSKMQAKLAAAEAEKAEAQKAAEREKLSETERFQADLADARAAAAAAEAARDAALADSVNARRTAELAAHGLRSTKFAPVLLGQYDPDEHGTVAEFVAVAKADPEFAVLFAAPKVVPPAGAVPAAGGTAGAPKNAEFKYNRAEMVAEARACNMPVDDYINLQKARFAAKLARS